MPDWSASGVPGGLPKDLLFFGKMGFVHHKNSPTHVDAIEAIDGRYRLFLSAHVRNPTTL